MYRIIKYLIFMAFAFALIANNAFAQDYTSQEVQQNIQKNLNDVRVSLNNILPYEYQSQELKDLVSSFLNEYKSYQERYFVVIGELPEIIGPDAISQIDKILSEEKGFNTNDLKNDFSSLLKKINEQIVPLVKVEFEKFNTQLSRTDNVGKYRGPLGEGQDVLSNRLNELIKKLDKYESNLRKLRTKLLKEESSFSKKAKAYMNTRISLKEGEPFKKLDITMPDLPNKPKNVAEAVGYTKALSKRLRNLYLIDDIGTIGLVDEEKTVAELGIEEIKETKSRIQSLKDLADKQSLTKDEVQSAFDIVEIVDGISSAKYDGVGKTPAFHMTLQAHVGGCLNMYFAMVMRDVFHALSGGQFLSQTQRANYKKYKYEDWNQRLEHLFSRYGKWETHVTMASFIVTAELVRTKLPSTFVMEEIFKRSDRWLYGIGGRTLIRGVSIYGLSFGLGMKVSEIVGTALMLRGEFSSGNAKIRALAWDLFFASNFSEQSLEEMLQTIVSFGMADIIFDGRTLPRFYDKMKKLNKKVCAYTFEDILNDARETQLANRDYSRWYSPKSLVKMSAIVITADFIDNYFVSLFLFPSAKTGQEALVLEKYKALAMAERNSLTESLLLAKSPKTELEDLDQSNEFEQIFDKYERQIFLTDIVKLLRNETSAIKTCLSFRDGKENTASKECLNTLYEVKSSKDVSFVTVVGKYTTNKEKKLENLAASEDYINSKENRDAIHDKVVNLLSNSEPKLATTKALQKIVTDEVMTDGIVFQQNIQYAKAMMIDNLKAGNEQPAINYLKKLLDLYYIRELSPLFSSVITAGLSDADNLIGSQTDLPPVIVLEGKTTISSSEGNKYLQKMIYLFTVIYPKMFNTKVSSKEGIQIEMNELRGEILTAIASHVYGKLSDNCDKQELEEANKVLDALRKKMLFGPKQESIPTILLVKMTDAYFELGLKKKI
ncbi:MAG: hypothetical protein WCQ47_06740, partial [bacterium]